MSLKEQKPSIGLFSECPKKLSFLRECFIQISFQQELVCFSDEYLFQEHWKNGSLLAVAYLKNDKVLLKDWSQCQSLTYPISLDSVISWKKYLSYQKWIFFESYKFNLQEGILFHPLEGHILLSRKESTLLHYLMTHQNPTPKRILLEEVWHYSEKIETQTLESHLAKLRQKLSVFKHLEIVFSPLGYFLKYLPSIIDIHLRNN